MKLMPSLTWKVDTADKKLFITFDDGPHPTITPWVLQTLKQFNAKATFFCVGDNVRKFPETYKQILAEGHRTGNHTFNHLNGWHTKNRLYYDNIEMAASFVKSDLFRPPYGRITAAQTRVLKKNYQIVMWDVLTCDFDKGLNVDVALDKCLRLAESGSIVVFHDSEKAAENMMRMLPSMLSHFSEKGFTFDAL
ncbi:MAG: polysaccharide deacetylase family protein [Bacteroidota bacterium]|jgi:peptidoglycan/xylan/chitin deacetylase (PgdA/CDA1 family)|nr:polysaccharide deacetylase family protein [Sphingobacteriales bacterium]